MAFTAKTAFNCFAPFYQSKTPVLSNSPHRLATTTEYSPSDRSDPNLSLISFFQTIEVSGFSQLHWGTFVQWPNAQP